MFIGSFDDDINEFQNDTQAAVAALGQAGVTRVLIDLTNNPGKSLLAYPYNIILCLVITQKFSSTRS